MSINIVNYPLSKYIKEKNLVKLSYKGPDSIIFLKTFLLGLALKEKDNELDVSIECHNNFLNWIIDPISLYDNFYKPILDKNIICEINYERKTCSNHIEIARQLELQYPLNISYFKDDIIPNKDILMCCNGPSTGMEMSLEKDLYDILKKQFNVDLFIVPNFHINENYLLKNVAKYGSCLSENIKLIKQYKYVIATDNFWLHLSTALCFKKTIGIFGPTIPNFITYPKNTHCIQFSDNINNKCPCMNSRYCQSKVKCLDSIDVLNLYSKIVKIINL